MSLMLNEGALLTLRPYGSSTPISFAVTPPEHVVQNVNGSAWAYRTMVQIRNGDGVLVLSKVVDAKPVAAISSDAPAQLVLALTDATEFELDVTMAALALTDDAGATYQVSSACNPDAVFISGPVRSMAAQLRAVAAPVSCGCASGCGCGG